MSEESAVIKEGEEVKENIEEVPLDLKRVMSKKLEGVDLSKFTADKLYDLVTQGMEEARAQEKKKLHTDLDNSKKDLEQTTGMLKKLQDDLVEKEKKLKESEEAKLSDVEKLQRKIIESEDRVSKLAEQQKKDAEEFQKMLSMQKLETYKEKKLRELREKEVSFIEGFVGGATQEEIDDSVNAAVSEYQKIADEVAKKVSQETPKDDKPKKPSLPGSKAPVMTPESPVELTADMVKNWTPKQYTENREALMKSIADQHRRR